MCPGVQLRGWKKREKPDIRIPQIKVKKKPYVEGLQEESFGEGSRLESKYRWGGKGTWFGSNRTPKMKKTGTLNRHRFYRLGVPRREKKVGHIVPGV